MKLVIYEGTFKTTPFINRLIQGLVKKGNEVYVLGFNEKIEQKLEDVKYISLGNSHGKIKFYFTSLKWAFKSEHIFNSLKNLITSNILKIKKANLKSALFQIKPDVVHVQWATHIVLFEELLQNKASKFVLSQRGYQTNVRPFVNAKVIAHQKKYLPFFDGFHSVSKAISKVGDLLYQATNKIDEVVYTGLEFSNFQFNAKVERNKVLKLVSVGRPHWIKGYVYAINACFLLAQKKNNFHYTIIGGAGNEELLFLIHNLGLQNKITLTKRLPQSKVFELIQESDVLLLPSIEEGIANVAVEAMALGTPVISADCGGMHELITHNSEGWIVPTYDVEAMAKQIITFTELSEDEIKRVKVAARKKVEYQHSETQMIKGMLRLYERVML